MKKLFGNLFIGVCTIFGLITLVGALLFAFNVIEFALNVFTIMFFLIEILLISVFCYLCYLYKKFKKKQKEKLKADEIRKNREAQLLALYKSFGIPPQKKPDGTLKNFYELLGIEPEYDEYGERVPTIYELFNIVPRFDANGNEIPSVVFIKNKVARLAVKVPAEILHLTKKPTEDEKELIQKQQQLKTEKKIATLSGDKKAAKSASAKLKGMPKRKQGYSSMETKNGKDKKGYSPDLGGIFSIGIEREKPEKKDKDEPKKEDKKPETAPDKKEVVATPAEDTAKKAEDAAKKAAEEVAAEAAKKAEEERLKREEAKKKAEEAAKKKNEDENDGFVLTKKSISVEGVSGIQSISPVGVAGVNETEITNGVNSGVKSNENKIIPVDGPGIISERIEE